MKTTHLRLLVMLCSVHMSSSAVLQRQKRNWIIDSFTIDEGYTGPFPYSLGKIKIDKNLNIFKIRGQGVDEEPKHVLQINEYTGEITVHQPVDYEKFPVLKLMFQAIDRENHVVETQLGIEIQISDSNDHPPKFEKAVYEISINKSTAQGTHLLTIKASDHDTDQKNGVFDFKIVSVTPKPQQLEFYLTQVNGAQHGTISFKGCLDHEKYTIIVEAKDRGEKIQLSSSCTVIINIKNGNDHPPVIIGQISSGSVKEREENVLVSRLQVIDKDTKGTDAWRVKYQIHGDTNANFRISTDPETNEGLLYVQKHLDYEDGPQKNVTISAENEIPYYSCKVVSRTATGLWIVDITVGATFSGAIVGGVTGTEMLSSSNYTVTVTVEDVNEPPIFDKPNKQVKLKENVAAGQYLASFTARDPDISSANTFVYSKGNDPANWIMVDAVTGKITTTKTIDRESPYVKDNIYTVTVYAVDNGKPPMTGTATLSIHISDENDNTPTLAVKTIDMCHSDGPTRANITAIDLDEEPYGGPFIFKLLGDVEGKWRVEPNQGYSVNLVKENKVHSGHFELFLELSDLQGETTLHNLSVTVCNCLNNATPNCHSRRAVSSAAGGGALVTMFFGILLLAGIVLLGLLVTCKQQQKEFPAELSEHHLMKYNIEEPGTDCDVSFDPLNNGYSQNLSQVATTVKRSTTNTTTAAVSRNYSNYERSQMEQQQSNNLQWLITDSVNKGSQGLYQSKRVVDQAFLRGNSMHWSSQRGSKYYAGNKTCVYWEIVAKELNKMLCNSQALEEKLNEDILHVYADEGESKTEDELDAISIPDTSFKPDLDPDLYFKLSTLASICMPSESTASITQTTCIMEKLKTATLVQMESQNTCISTQSHF